PALGRRRGAESDARAWRSDLTALRIAGRSDGRPSQGAVALATDRHDAGLRNEAPVGLAVGRVRAVAADAPDVHRVVLANGVIRGTAASFHLGFRLERLFGPGARARCLRCALEDRRVALAAFRVAQR